MPYNTGTVTGNPIFASGGDGLRLSTVSNLLSPTERINLDTLMHFQVNDRLNAFGEGYFSETHATNLISQPAYNSNLFGKAGTSTGNFVISINNPVSDARRSRIDPDRPEQLCGDIAVGPTLYPGVSAGPGTAGQRIPRGIPVSSTSRAPTWTSKAARRQPRKSCFAG